MLSSGAQVLIVDSCKAHDDDEDDDDDVDDNCDDDDYSCLTHGCDTICLEILTLYQVKKVTLEVGHLSIRTKKTKYKMNKKRSPKKLVTCR